MKTIFLLGVCMFVAPPVQAQVDVPLPPDTLDLVYFGTHAPVLLRLHATVDGQPIQERWRRHFLTFFRMLDKNKDGVLDERELPFAPKANYLFQQGGPIMFLPNRTISATPAEFGKQAGDKIDLGTFLRTYHDGAGPLRLTPGNFGAGNDRLSEVIFQRLDTNKDGKLSRAELDHAWSALRPLDADDDDLIVAQEIVPAFNPFQTRVLGGAGMMGAPANPANQGLLPGVFFRVNGPQTAAPLAALILSHFDKDKNGLVGRKEIALPDEVFAKLDKNQNGDLDAAELAAFADRAADYEWVLRLSTENGKAPTWTLAPDAGQPSLVALPGADIGFIGMESPNPLQQQSVFNFVQQQFQAADKDKKGFVELKDLQNPQFQYVKQMFGVLDLDDDGKVTRKEIEQYAEFRKESYHNQVQVRVVEQGQTLFQLLDRDRDGRLSQRELRQAWKHLLARDRNQNGLLEQDEIPKQFQITAGRGIQAAFYNPGMLAGNTPVSKSRGPAWFRKMDVNGDGDLSVREFLGSRADFDRIDSNRDGLIDADEAEAFAKTSR